MMKENASSKASAIYRNVLYEYGPRLSFLVFGELISCLEIIEQADWLSAIA